MAETLSDEPVREWRARMRRESNISALDDLRRYAFPRFRDSGIDTAAIETVIQQRLDAFSPLPQPRHKRVAAQMTKLGECVASMKALAIKGDLPGPLVSELEAVAVRLSDEVGIGLSRTRRGPGAPPKTGIMDYADKLEVLLRPLPIAKRYQRLSEILMHTLPMGYQSTPSSLERQLRNWRAEQRSRGEKQPDE